MKTKVHFIKYNKYWVAEAENGAVSQGTSFEECSNNIKDAVALLEEFMLHEDSIVEEFDDVIEVSI